MEMTEMDGALLRSNGQPLYVQVKNILIRRITAGAWGPGQILPSEMRLADELGVSQGTVRKALDVLADASLVERRQGHGTFIAEHTEATVHFKFFQIYDADGNRVTPDMGITRIDRRKAGAGMAASLSLRKGAGIYEINRVRTHKDAPILIEIISLPQQLFPGLDRRAEIPNALYDVFQKNYGITIVRVQEDSTAVLASKSQAKKLATEAGAPLLKIDRVAYDLEDRPVERRVSFCVMGGLKYRASLS